jgi:hypothetical protein
LQTIGTKKLLTAMLVGIMTVPVLFQPSVIGKEALPVEPDENTRLDELYDHEARMFLFLYSLKGNGEVDYVTGRMVEEHARSHYGNPVYYTEPYPLFYWWNHTMYNDPERDGVNGN